MAILSPLWMKTADDDDNCFGWWWIITWVRKTPKDTGGYFVSSVQHSGPRESEEIISGRMSGWWVGDQSCVSIAKANQVARLLHLPGYSPPMCVCQCHTSVSVSPRNVKTVSSRFVSPPHGLLRVSCFRPTTPWGSSLTGSFLSRWSVKATNKWLGRTNFAWFPSHWIFLHAQPRAGGAERVSPCGP